MLKVSKSLITYFKNHCYFSKKYYSKISFIRGNFISKFDTMSKIYHESRNIRFCQIVRKWTYVNKLLIYWLCTNIMNPLHIEEVCFRFQWNTQLNVYDDVTIKEYKVSWSLLIYESILDLTSNWYKPKFRNFWSK